MTSTATSASLAALESYEVLDPAQVAELEGIVSPEGPTLLSELADLLRAEMPVRLKAMADDIAHRRARAIAAKAHALAGSSASLGARQLQQAVRQLEEAAHDEDWVQIPALFSAIETVWQRLDGALRGRVRY